MPKILIIPFAFNDKVYYSLIHIHKKNDSIELQIKLMNSDIANLLQGNDTFVLKDGQLCVDPPFGKSESSNLRLQIADALKSHLNTKSIAELF